MNLTDILNEAQRPEHFWTVIGVACLIAACAGVLWQFGAAYLIRLRTQTPCEALRGLRDECRTNLWPEPPVKSDARRRQELGAVVQLSEYRSVRRG